MQQRTFQILMFFSMMFWGATWVNAKVLGSYLGSYELTFWRFFFSSLTLIPIIFLLKLSFKITRRTLVITIFTAIFMAIYNHFFFLGTLYGEAHFGGVLVTTLIPINTFIFMAIFFGKKIGRKSLFALFLGAIGTSTLIDISSFSLESILSEEIIYFLIASLLWPVVTIGSSFVKDTSAVVTGFYIYIFTSILALIPLDFTVHNPLGFDLIFWLNLFILTVLGTSIATSVYFLSTVRLGSKKTSSYIFLVPLSAMIFSYIFLGEKIYINTIIGGILIIIAVYILNGFTIRDLKEKFGIKNG